MGHNERRVLKLREHVLSHNKKKDKKTELSDKTMDDLKEIAKEKGLEGYSKLKKEELIELLLGSD